MNTSQTIAIMIRILILPFLFTTAFADDPTGGYFEGYESDCSEIKEHAESNVVNCNMITLKKANEALDNVYNDLIKQADKDQKTYLEDMQAAWERECKSNCASASVNIIG